MSLSQRTRNNRSRRRPRGGGSSNQRPGRPAASVSRPSAASRTSQRRALVYLGVGLLVVVGILFAVFSSHNSGASRAGSYPYAIGSPGPGSPAPNIHLTSTAGGSFDLAAQQNKTVLVFFQEGIDCEPCWTQLRDIQGDMSAFQAAGINEVVSVTTDPLAALRQKATDEGLRIPILSDPTLAVSRAYHANSYGMMGTGTDGHTFIVVGPTGRIEWRADYGGAPNYTMDVPVGTLLTQMRAGMAKGL